VAFEKRYLSDFDCFTGSHRRQAKNLGNCQMGDLPSVNVQPIAQM
jgi:hypothetical protein